MTDLSDPIENAKFILALNKAVDEYCIKEFTDDPRNHLGASIIGSDCAAYSWGVFRWLKKEPFSGQQLRLFNRGHEEEARFIRWLRGAGLTVWDIDDSGNQFRIIGCKGHFGGSLDGASQAPKFIQGLVTFLLEFKTHNDRSFKDMQKKKLVRSKPKHWKQMCSYGRAYNLEYGLYCAVNKNTDELYFELVKLDYAEADDLFRKAETIIFTQEQPQKIAQVATYQECVYCPQQGICFRGEAPDKNCRSCRNAFPVDDGKWTCSLVNQHIPAEVIKVGCNSYARIIN